MFDVWLDEDYLIDTEGTSDGTQSKYYADGFWYKTNNEGREDIVEYLVSKMLTFTDLPDDAYVVYERGLLNGHAACRSRSFFSPDESFTTLERLHANVTGQPLHEKIRMTGIDASVEYVLRFFDDVIGLDLSEYFKRVFTADYISLNEDRHFHNLGVIREHDGKFRPAPIFDNGKSLLNANPSVDRSLPISENVKRVTARPFSGSHRETFEKFGKGFDLNREYALQWLDTEEPSFYRDVLIHQIKTVKL